jgi:hypothetical protein
MRIGSKEWFLEKVRELRRDFRALDSVTSSIENVTALIRLWGDSDITVMSALHNMAIISYGRMFTKRKKLDVEFKVDLRDFVSAPEAHPAVPGWSICSMRVPCAGDQRRAEGTWDG